MLKLFSEKIVLRVCPALSLRPKHLYRPQKRKSLAIRCPFRLSLGLIQALQNEITVRTSRVCLVMYKFLNLLAFNGLYSA